MSDNRLEVVSNAVLAGTGIYCLSQIRNQNFTSSYMTYGVIVVNNVAAVLHWFTGYHSRLREFVEFAAFSQVLFTLPCVTTQVWLQSGYPKEASWAWTVVVACPILSRLMKEDWNGLVVDLIIMSNLIGLGYVCFVKEINAGMAAAVVYASAYCYITDKPLYNYALCVFCYLSLRTLGVGGNVFKS